MGLIKSFQKSTGKTIATLICLCLSVAAHATLKIYPALSNMQGCQFNYSLQVKEPGDQVWKTVPLYNALVTSSTSQNEFNTTVANFDCDGPVDIKIIFSKTVTSAAVYPSSFGVTPNFSGDSITFTIPNPKKFYVDINGDHYNNCIHIIANPIETFVPDSTDPNVIFIPTGKFVDSTISLQSGQTLYVQGGAAIAGVYAWGVSNVKVLGRGFIYRPSYDALGITHSRNVTIDGLIDLNHGWGNGGGCGFRCGQDSNVVISNTTSFSALKWGDGYDIFCSDSVIVDNVFIRTNDDAICFYGGGASSFTGICKSIYVKNSTLLPDLAHSFNVGIYGDTTGTGQEIRDIYVSNVDICNASRTTSQGCISFMVSDKIRAANFHFDSVRVQNFVNARLITMNLIKYSWYYGRAIDSIYYNNISFTGSGTPNSVIAGNNASQQITNVFFTNLKINGSEIANAANGNVSIGSYTQNIIFNTTGAIPVITSATTANATIGTPFNYAITANNSPTNYIVTGLPSGLILDTITGIISGTPTAAGTFNMNLKVSNDSGSGISPLTLTIAPIGNPIARYSFDNSAFDSSGNGFTAALNGSTSYSAGAIGKAVKFNGTPTSYISLPQGILNTASDITIAGWVNLDTVATSSRIFDMGTDSTSYIYLTPRNSVGKAFFGILTSGGTEQNISASSQLPAGRWVHIAVSLSGNTGTLYVNGDTVGVNTSLTYNPSDLGTTARNFIGHSQWTTDPYLKGRVDEFYIYNKALNATQIDSLIGKGPALITSADSTTGFQDHPFTYNPAAINSATSYNATGLPSGLSINTSTGYITGTPSQNGIFPVSLIVTNPNGTDTALLALTIKSDTVSTLFAAGGDHSDTLFWDPLAIATSYNIKRAETSGGPYTIIGNTTNNGFKDTTIINGHTYYYVVSMIDSLGEHPNSLEVSASPNAGQSNYYNLDETSGTKAFDHWGGKTGTLMSSNVAHVPGIINGAVRFDGTANSYISLPAGVVSKLTSFTICAWVKTDVAATWERVFDFGTGTTNYMFLTTNNGSNDVRYAITTGSGEQGINSSAPISIGAWHHIAVTWSGNVGILYIDGVQAGINSSMTLNPSSLGITNQNYIGKSQWNDPIMTGSIDEFRIYNRALSAAGIDSLIAGYIPPPSPANLFASPGNNQVALKWNSSLGASKYVLLRSTGDTSNYSILASNISDTIFTDTTAYNCGVYYYAVIASNNSGSSDTSTSATAYSGSKLTGLLIGTDSSWSNNPVTTKSAAVDGDMNTYFDAPEVTGDWVGYDLGVGDSTIIREIRYAPRAGIPARMVNGLFQGANKADFSDAVTLFTVSSAPAANVMTAQIINNNQAFRYLRYLGPTNGSCNIAEMEFWGVPAKLSTITNADTIKTSTDSALNYSIIANNMPSNFSANNLPDGLTLSSCTGILTGTATNDGTFTVPVSITNYLGTSIDTLIIVVENNQRTLPIRLLDFTGKLSSNNVALNWETATESNSDHFEVQRSIDAINFISIGKIGAAGNSIRPQNYSFNDNIEKLSTSPLYYRLLMVDKDGQIINSQIVTITKGDDGNILSVYPNPALNNITIQFNSAKTQKVTIHIASINGIMERTISKEINTGINKINIGLNNISHGVHMVSLTEENGYQHLIKMIKQ